MIEDPEIQRGHSLAMSVIRCYEAIVRSKKGNLHYANQKLKQAICVKLEYEKVAKKNNLKLKKQ